MSMHAQAGTATVRQFRVMVHMDEIKLSVTMNCISSTLITIFWYHTTVQSSTSLG